MVPTAVASAILNAATRQLQLSNQLFAGKNLVLNKFGEELTKQLNSTAAQQHLTTGAHSGPRPITFLAGGAESAVAASVNNSTSKGSSKKKANRSIPGTSHKTRIAKR